MSINTFAELLELHPLAAAVVEQLGYDAEDAEQLADCLGDLSDVASHGADTGWCGFTNYTDTVAFTEAHRAAIMQQAEQDADDFGTEGGSIALIAGFRYIEAAGLSVSAVARAIYDADDDDRTVVMNSLAWYALESVAQACDR